MGLLSIIGTGAALLNYQKAKQEYETVVGEIDSLEKAVLAASAHHEKTADELEQEAFERELQAELDAININEVDNPEALKVSTVCKVANLVGSLARARVQLLITNTGAKTYYITNPSVVCYVFSEPIVATDVKVGEQLVHKDTGKPVTEEEQFARGADIFNKSDVDWESENIMDVPEELRGKIIAIKPGETKVIDFPKQVTGAGEGVFDKLRKIICHYCNRSLITSCWKVNITDYWYESQYYQYLETATILFNWTADEELAKRACNQYRDQGLRNEDIKQFKTANYRGVPGVLRYCMELSLIGE